MGMLNNSGDNGFVKYARNLILKLFVKLNDKFIFLGIGEFEKAKENFKQKNKFVFFPFCVDSSFFGKVKINITRQKEKNIIYWK